MTDTTQYDCTLTSYTHCERDKQEGETAASTMAGCCMLVMQTRETKNGSYSTLHFVIRRLMRMNLGTQRHGVSGQNFADASLWKICVLRRVAHQKVEKKIIKIFLADLY